ncbi:MAG TPA: ATP-binding protein [Candidatus Saccharibacteria bacterium]|nr:ATP-binding protein [Candidatus Saccharibacteria bacterium]
MRPMFESATLKLTGWYILILMATSLMFSVALYQITINGASVRVDHLQSLVEESANPQAFSTVNWVLVKSNQLGETSLMLIAGLFYINIIVLVIGGVGSFFLARRTLRPIEYAHEAQSRFSSDASHELRTPLSSMRTTIEVALRDNSATKQSFREVLVSNLEEVEKLSRLSQMLLDLSKLQYDKLEFGPIELKPTIQNTLKTLQTNEKRVNIKGVKNFIVHGNQDAIEELFTILIDNAIKYSPPKSVVIVTTRRRNRQACIEVENIGDGIPADKLVHIFDRFYRADSSRTGSGGHGLGLSLAKKIVEIHSGELSATSAPGKTTTFTVLLPFATGRR